MSDFGKLSYDVLLDYFSKSQSERDNYDFSDACSKLVEIFDKIPGEPLDDFAHNAHSSHYIHNIDEECDSSNNGEAESALNTSNHDEVEYQELNTSDFQDTYEIKLSPPPVSVDSKFRSIFPHVAACYDQVSSGEIVLDGQYSDITDMWNEASISCLVNPSELERSKSSLVQSLIQYLTDKDSVKYNESSAFDHHPDSNKSKQLLNLMSWYFAGYYTAKIED